MNTKRLIPLLAVIILFLGCAYNPLAWRKSLEPDTGNRFIPIELWSGESWSGDLTLTPAPATSFFGKRSHKSIRGPFPWRHPVTGEDLQVYERVNMTTQGLKRQLFTVNPDQTGLAKVYDERPGMPTRYFSTNAVLFPLGRWQRGEKRVFTFDEYVGGRKQQRTATVYIRRLSFSYKGVQYALKYDWICQDAQGKAIFHERFIYGPGRSLMYFQDRLEGGA